MGLCIKRKIQYIIPGGEKPMILIGRNRKSFENEGISYIGNSEKVIEVCSSKAKTFKILSSLGFKVPFTKSISILSDLDDMIFPCIIKPSAGSGGSVTVFLAENQEEAGLYVNYLLRNGKPVIAQDYIPHEEGEFTVGVLSSKNQEIFGSIALKRIFSSKLSVLFKSEIGLISTGYSQGLIDSFPDVTEISERIAKSISSEGPINIQGRIRDGTFIPFEINPRFSASTYLRALAGFNEVDIYLKYLINGRSLDPIEIKPGYYLRSFTEKYVRKEELKK